MKPTRTTLVVVLLATFLVGATGAVLATSGEPAAPAAPVPAAATPSSAPSGAPRDRDDMLTGVLDDLVAKGTITAAQRKAILDGVGAERDARQAERDARQAERKAAREQAKADRQQIREFLADGVITKAEFDTLPADSPLRALTTLMDDGKITADELKSVSKGWKGMLNNGGQGGKGHGWGRGGNPDKAQPTASPATGG